MVEVGAEAIFPRTTHTLPRTSCVVSKVTPVTDASRSAKVGANAAQASLGARAPCAALGVAVAPATAASIANTETALRAKGLSGYPIVKTPANVSAVRERKSTRSSTVRAVLFGMRRSTPRSA